MDTKNPASPTLGSVLRRLRSRQGWTLKEMSERVGIPVSTLSKVEHDRLSLPYDKVQHISQRMGIPMSEMLVDPESPGAGPAVTARRSLGGLDSALHVAVGGYEYFYLSPELRNKRMIPVLGRVSVQSVSEFKELMRHSGEEFIYVIDGAIKVHTEFYDPVVVRAGHSIYLDSSMGHVYVAEQCEVATILAVMSSPDEVLAEGLLSHRQEEAAGKPAG